MIYEKVEESINDLKRVNKEVDSVTESITFYKQVIKTAKPIIIDLVGASGAGKTTFCLQFVDEEGKKMLSKTISTSGNSNIIQTDIIILEDTKSRLFLKARTKSDIISDLILVALNINPEYKFDIKKCITHGANSAGVMKNNDMGAKTNIELFQGVYNLFRNVILIQKFQEIAKELQLNFTKEDDIRNYIINNITNENLIKLLDNIIYSKLNIDNFYGYRHEISLDEENILEKTIVPTKIFNKYKEQLEEFHEIVSYRLLFEHAILMLKFDDKTKQRLPKKLKEGVVFRNLQGNKKIEEGTSANLKVDCKILIIAAATGGELVDGKFVVELKDIIKSDQKCIVVITKIDKTSSYEEYTRNDYEAFIESLKQQVATTRNDIIGKLEEAQEVIAGGTCKFDKDTIERKIFETFDNAYLSKITKDKQGEYDAEIHKIVCKNKNNQEISANDIDDIIIVENPYTCISSILDRKTRVIRDMSIRKSYDRLILA
ncbi:hypothetical protein [Clostridium lacusfryxellense]|uniref:hypothetical protein n=1 Tax=Clostridium lacusfryxellense TaxID=205328 RepID=UPI001C0DCC9D|nr:hypothetical protein [Clostridium lacusfryxellense]MBU3112674.1 hypothetical protein [Clostridium lacusfryxellense]